MKHLSRVVIAVFLTVIMAVLTPAQVFADTPEYISEVKVFMGDNSAAEAQAEGYTLLTDGSNPVDLNEKAGGAVLVSKGEKAVYLGYKTTDKREEAITDLALMNMKGGYSVKEYEVLMETQMKSQIIPFVEMFLSTINEYRANYNSKNKANKKRAQYIHDVLNKLTDDDCGGAELGDLLLNETKYEMGDEAYNKLSDEEKNEHADILTIIAQANGKAVLLMENLLARAADTGDSTWFERFKNTTYDDLIASTGKTPTDARKILAKTYDDDAQTVFGTWENLREALENYDEAIETVKAYDESSFEDASDAMEDLKDSSPDVDEAAEAVIDFKEAQIEYSDYQDALHNVMLHDYLKSIEYLDGTMLDFFLQSEEEIEDDITVLYPIAASLSEGQKAGLEFCSLKEMLLIGITDMEGYRKISFDEMEKVSVYDGVDRGIYEKGGVALTRDALRADALLRENEETSMLSKWTEMMWIITISTGLAALASNVTTYVLKSIADAYGITMWNGVEAVENNFEKVDIMNYFKVSSEEQKSMAQALNRNINAERNYLMENGGRTGNAFFTASKVTKYITVGLTVALVLFTAFTIYLTYNDMVEHYKVKFTPIPHYMIDEKDLVGYNSKGEKVILKNQSAYYKAVECNRTESDEFYSILGTCADMNGDVGAQWLALYAVKNEATEPILASSLTVVKNSTTVPAGYSAGIHMFGSDAVFNLNSTPYDWNKEAPKIYVYFKTDSKAAGATGSNFTAGTLALAGGCGLLLGACITALCMKATGKRRENKANVTA